MGELVGPSAASCLQCRALSADRGSVLGGFFVIAVEQGRSLPAKRAGQRRDTAQDRTDKFGPTANELTCGSLTSHQRSLGLNWAFACLGTFGTFARYDATGARAWDEP
ncbi:hypothetical protein [Mycobacterium intracellulare]|uniref:hypothetical protein n=1 Tax=Mycobacterium intracellulare TaxID=1767 RepID=UPI0012BC5397|nr:hypothetical protein [Mycobacterium intracellulare]MCA2273618.1 hypothetical protein [Mycobacterium intracellulare]MCA2325715.1 hypothetical protein [Mycobacterium intracellulare]UEB26547.1 hypothetical protein LK403_10410 [Mycobacterium intracellulare]WVL05517.1 hypothetical protein KN247_25885 [Mycobacterium intracellulare]